MDAFAKKQFLKNLLNGVKTPETEFVRNVTVHSRLNEGKTITPSPQYNQAETYSAPQQTYYAGEAPERDVPMNMYDNKAMLMERLAKKQGVTLPTPEYKTPTPEYRAPISMVQEMELQPKQQIGYGQIDRKLVEEVVYEILGKIIDEQNENRLNEETIRIKIGNTIFSGNLTPIKQAK